MVIVIQPYICYFVCNLYKQILSYFSLDCNEFHIKFPDYIDMQVYIEYKMSQIRNYIFVGAVKEHHMTCLPKMYAKQNMAISDC